MSIAVCICTSANTVGFRPGGATPDAFELFPCGRLKTLARGSYGLPVRVAVKARGCSERWEPDRRSDASRPLTRHRPSGRGCRDRMGLLRRPGSSEQQDRGGIGQPGQPAGLCPPMPSQPTPTNEHQDLRERSKGRGWKKKGAEAKNWRARFFGAQSVGAPYMPVAVSGNPPPPHPLHTNRERQHVNR